MMPIWCFSKQGGQEMTLINVQNSKIKLIACENITADENLCISYWSLQKHRKYRPKLKYC